MALLLHTLLHAFSNFSIDICRAVGQIEFSTMLESVLLYGQNPDTGFSVRLSNAHRGTDQVCAITRPRHQVQYKDPSFPLHTPEYNFVA